MSDILDNANAILIPLINGGTTDEDELMTALANAGGFSIKRIPSLVTQILQDEGLRTSPKERNEAVAELFASDTPTFGTWDDVIAAAERVCDHVANTTTAQAVTSIKKWAKANGVELPSKPKAAAGGSRRNAYDAFAEWFLANPQATDTDINDYALGAFLKDGEPNEKQAVKYAAIFIRMAAMARAYQA